MKINPLSDVSLNSFVLRQDIIYVNVEFVGLGRFCGNLQNARVTCTNLSNFWHFSRLALTMVLYQLLPFYQPFAIFSPLCHLLTFYVIKAPYVCTCSTRQITQLSLPSYRLHGLCANTPFQLKRCPWPSCHPNVVGSRHGWGFSPKTKWQLTWNVNENNTVLHI